MRVQVVNWEKFNGRKDVKNCTWFRLDNKFFFDPKIWDLDLPAKALFIFILGLASVEGKESFHFSPKQAAQALGVSSSDINKYVKALADAGCIVLVEPTEGVYDRTHEKPRTETAVADKVSGPYRQTDRHTYITPKGVSATVQPHDVQKLYNEHRGGLPESRSLSKSRLAKIKTRLKEHPDLSYWQEVFATAGKSPFLCGDNDRGWKANLAWLVENDSNHLKVIEGNYSQKDRNENAKEALKRWAEEENTQETLQ